MRIIFTWILVALALFLSTKLLSGISIDNFYTALLISFLWGLINILIKPIIILLTLPINIITLGLFTFVINGFLFWSLSVVIPGFQVTSFLDAILATLFISAAHFVADMLTKAGDHDD